ncbi:F-box/LRR-repeat protein 15-like [Oppia nitens]|uniref:F-box/LRR-repeat protein 15-like n=1 Tax=Oppia nitens TaxID=1686743 RepID=UPI0023DB9EE7|nr:F-box/LRR-repeat protein 15-like [Oppia nitens]
MLFQTGNEKRDQLVNNNNNDKNMSDVNEMDDNFDHFLQIPWNDIIFPYILRYLSWRDLFRLRSVSSAAQQMVSEYFSSLSVIDLTPVRRRFTSHCFDIISRDCHSIRILNLSDCKWISSPQLYGVIANNAQLVVVDISGCYELNNDILHMLATTCKSLKTLKLKDCHWVNGNAIRDIGLNCTFLEDLNLSSCWEVSDESAIDLITHCPNLRQLSLSKIYGITDRTLFTLASNAPNLEYLDVSGCWRITDYGIRKVGEYCNALSHLHVGDCRDVTDDSLSYLKGKGIYIDSPRNHRTIHLNPYLNQLAKIRLQV